MKEGLIAFFKVFFFILLLPLLYAVTIAFQTQILGIPPSKEVWLLAGALAYVVMNLFICDFKEVYQFGHQITSKALGFMTPIVGVIGYLLPIYTILIIVGKLILGLFNKTSAYDHYFLFAIAFSWMMHVIMSAREMHEGDSSPLKAQYFFGFSVIYVINLFVMAMLLAAVISEFSLLVFANSFAHQTLLLYKSAYHLLFVD